MPRSRFALLFLLVVLLSAVGAPPAQALARGHEFTIPTAGSYPWGITAGPDGNLWFTEYSGNNIGRITTSGAITEFPLPTANSAPFGITAGPDGNLWFTEFVGNKIGRITTSGAITEVPLPTANSAPYGITAGPGGIRLWFTEASGDKIAVMRVAAEVAPPGG